jgi:hypothetical protein
VVLHRLNSAATLIQRTTTEAPRGHMYYIGLDVHKKTISLLREAGEWPRQQEGKVGSTRCELGCWTKPLAYSSYEAHLSMATPVSPTHTAYLILTKTKEFQRSRA